jgi:serine/threonine-protein kinase
MPAPDEDTLEALIARIGAGEAIDPADIPAHLRGHPVLERLLGIARVAQAFDRQFEANPEADVPAPGARIGPWKLVRRLGSGGMGDVWLGERDDGIVEQQVAIKCVRVPSQDFRDRLVSERRILARLEHPNIARFIDAGVDAGGSPWFALEYVEGVSITDWCAQQAMPLRARLQLFAKVCAAVAHAHRHLVVHRDLKPGNVLVNADGEPKLLDFGIAKLLDGSIDDYTYGALTPSYAAPEQLRGEAVSTATDVYVLGLLLFRLLAGTLPATRASGNAGVVLQQIDAEETQRPSTRAGLADPRLPYPAGELEGDLDAIVAQAIRARPDARYGSVAELSADIDRFLQSRPVRARAPSRRYRFSRFAQRNRIALVLGTFAALALIVGTLVSMHQAQRATREAQSAQRQLQRAEQISAFLASLFREQDPLSRAGARVRAPEAVLADAVGRVGRELGGDAESMARLLGVLGEAQLNVNDFKGARGTLEQARAAAVASGDRLLVADIDSLCGVLALRELAHDDAEALFASALRTATELRGADSLEAARIEARQAHSLVVLGKFKEALGVAEHSQAVLTRSLGPDHRESIDILVTLGILQDQARKDAEALVTLREAVARIEAVFGPDDARLVVPLQTLGEVLRRTRDFDSARTALLRGTAIARAQFGPRNSQVTRILIRLSGIERDAGRLNEAIAVLQEAEDALPDDEDGVARVQLISTRGSIHLELEDGVRAEADYREALALRHKAGDQRSGLQWFTQAQLGNALAFQGKFAEAHRLQAEAAKELRALIGPDAYQNALIALRQSQAYKRQGDLRGSIPFLREALRIADKTYGPDHFMVADWSLELADTLSALDDGRDEAAGIAEQLVAKWPSRPEFSGRLATLELLRCRVQDDPASAATIARSALAREGFTATDEERPALQRFADSR